MMRFKKIWFLLLIAGVIASVPFSLRYIALSILNYSLKGAKHHKASIGSCSLSLKGVAFQNVDIEWNESRFSSDEIEIKFPSFSGKGHFRIPVVFQHPQLFLSDESSCQNGLKASLGVLLKLDPFVNHGVVEINKGSFLERHEESLEKKYVTQRYYFWSEYFSQTEKIFFFDRNPLLQGEPIASLLVRKVGPKEDQYELRIDNLDGESLLTLASKQWGNQKFSVQSAPEGLISLRAQGSWSGEKLLNVSGEIEGINAFLLHPMGIVRAEEWNVKGSIDELPLDFSSMGLSTLKAIDAQLELRGMKIHDLERTCHLEKGEMSLALAHGLVSGTMNGSLQGEKDLYQVEMRGTFDLFQNAVDATVNLSDAQGALSQMEITADFSNQKEALISAKDFPAELLLPAAFASLNKVELSKGAKGDFLSDRIVDLKQLQIQGKLNGYCQLFLKDGMHLKDAELDLSSLSIQGEKIAIRCPKADFSYQLEPMLDLSIKTVNTTVEWKGEKIGEGRFQLLQNPETKMTGFVDGQFKGQEVSLSWAGEKQNGIFSLTSSEHITENVNIASNYSSLFTGLDIRGSWNREKDRVSIDLERVFGKGHAELVFFDDGTGGFYFEKVPAEKFIPLVFNQAGLRSGYIQGSGEWNRDQLESSLEIENLACGHFFTSSEAHPAVSGLLRTLSVELPKGEAKLKIDFKESGYSLETEPFQIEVSHPLSEQKIFLSGSLKGDSEKIEFLTGKLDSEWGSFQGAGYFAQNDRGAEIKIQSGGGELVFDKGSSSLEMQAFLNELFKSAIQFETASLAVPEGSFELLLKKGLFEENWQKSFLLAAHLDLPQLNYKGFAIEDFEAEVVAKENEVSLTQGRCAFDIPGGRRVLSEEITALYSKEKKEFYSRIDLGNLSLMNLHLFLDMKDEGKNWKLYSQKATLLGNPLEIFAIGSFSEIEKWTITTALDGSLLKPLVKKVPFLESISLLNQHIPIELTSQFGNAEHFEGRLADITVKGQLTSSFSEIALSKEDFHFDASWKVQNKIVQGKGSAITPDHKIAFSSAFDLEKVEGVLNIAGDSFTGGVSNQPLHLHYLVDIGLDSLSWRAEVKEFQGKWNEYRLKLIKPAECKKTDQGIFCAGNVGVYKEGAFNEGTLKEGTLLAKGDFELKKNRVSATLDVDLPKLHFCKNIDFLNATKLRVESDIAKLSELDVTSSDVEIYIVDLKEKITLCNSEIALSLSKSPPIHLKSILKTSYNPFDVDLKINPKESALPAEFTLTDKATGEHLVGGFTFSSGGLIPQFFQGNFLGSYLEGKRNGDNFNITLKMPLLNPIVNKAFPSLMPLYEKPLLSKAILELRGDVISQAHSKEGNLKADPKEKEWIFLGNAEVKGFDLKNAPQGKLFSRIQYRNKELSLLDLQSAKMPFELKVRKALFNFDGEEIEMRVPSIAIKNFIPSQLIPGNGNEKQKSNWNLTHVSLIDLQGILKEPKTWKAKGNAHFASVQKGVFSFTKNFKVALEQMGLSSSTLRPAVGDIDFSFDKGKVVLEDLKNSFSEGGATAFILSPNSRHFIYFDGSLNIELEPKPLQGLPWTQHVKVKIKGNLDQPEYQVR